MAKVLKVQVKELSNPTKEKIKGVVAMTRNNIGIHVNFLDLSLAIVADGVSWSPDVADDMTRRMKNLFDESISTLVLHGFMQDEIEQGEFEDEESEDDEEEEAGNRPSKELIDPNVIFLMEKEFGENNG